MTSLVAPLLLRVTLLSSFSIVSGVRIASSVDNSLQENASFFPWDDEDYVRSVGPNNQEACQLLSASSIQCNDIVQVFSKHGTSELKRGYVGWPHNEKLDFLCVFKYKDLTSPFGCWASCRLILRWGANMWKRCISIEWHEPWKLLGDSVCRRALLEAAQVTTENIQHEAQLALDNGACEDLAGSLSSCLVLEYDYPALWSKFEVKGVSRRKLAWSSGNQAFTTDSLSLVRHSFQKLTQNRFLPRNRFRALISDVLSSIPGLNSEAASNLLQDQEPEGCHATGCTEADIAQIFDDFRTSRIWPEVAPLAKGICLAEDILDAAIPPQRINEPIPGWRQLNGYRPLKGRAGIFLGGSSFLNFGIHRVSVRNLEGSFGINLPRSEYDTSNGWKFTSDRGSSSFNFSFSGPTDGTLSPSCGEKFEVDVELELEILGLSTIETCFLGICIDAARFLGEFLKVRLLFCLNVKDAEEDFRYLSDLQIDNIMNVSADDIREVEMKQRDTNCKSSNPDECWKGLLPPLLSFMEGKLVDQLKGLIAGHVRRFAFEFTLKHLIQQMAFVFLGGLDKIVSNFGSAFFHCRNQAKDNPQCGLKVPHLVGKTTDLINQAAQRELIGVGWDGLLGLSGNVPEMRARERSQWKSDVRELTNCRQQLQDSIQSIASACHDSKLVATKEASSGEWVPLGPAFGAVYLNGVDAGNPSSWQEWMRWADRDASGEVTMLELALFMQALGTEESTSNKLMIGLYPHVELFGHTRKLTDLTFVGPQSISRLLPQIQKRVDDLPALKTLLRSPVMRRPSPDLPEWVQADLRAKGRDPLLPAAPLVSDSLVRPLSVPQRFWAGLSVGKLLPEIAQIALLTYRKSEEADGAKSTLVKMKAGLDLDLNYILENFVSSPANLDHGYVFASSPMLWGEETVIAVVNCNVLRIFKAAPVFTDGQSCEEKREGDPCQHDHPIITVEGEVVPRITKHLKGTCLQGESSYNKSWSPLLCATSWRPVIRKENPFPLHEQPLEQVLSLWLANIGQKVVDEDRSSRDGFARCAKSQIDANTGEALNFVTDDLEPICGAPDDLPYTEESYGRTGPHDVYLAVKQLLSVAAVGWTAAVSNANSQLWKELSEFAIQDLGSGKCLILPVNYAWVDTMKAAERDVFHFTRSVEIDATETTGGFQWLCLKPLKEHESNAEELFNAMVRQFQRNLLQKVDPHTLQPTHFSRDALETSNVQSLSITGRVESLADSYASDYRDIFFFKPMTITDYVCTKETSGLDANGNSMTTLKELGDTSVMLCGLTADERNWEILPSANVERQRAVSWLWSAVYGDKPHVPEEPLEQQVEQRLSIIDNYFAQRRSLWSRLLTDIKDASSTALKVWKGDGLEPGLENQSDKVLLKCKHLISENVHCGQGCLCWSSCKQECGNPLLPDQTYRFEARHEIQRKESCTKFFWGRHRVLCISRVVG